MKTIFSKSLLAASMLVAFGSAIASDDLYIPTPSGSYGYSSDVADSDRFSPDNSDSISVSETVWDSKIRTRLEWKSDAAVTGEASANGNTIQHSTDNVSANLERSPNTATLRENAANGTGGNIGVNLTAGAGNLQGNSAAIVSSDAHDVFASASTYSEQVTMSNFSFSLNKSNNDANMEAALKGATGNIGVNLSAGAGNAQSNQLAMIDAAGTKVVRAQTSIEQASTANMSTNRSEWRATDSANTASIFSDAVKNVVGNIGLNVAAGAGNAQANALSVAVSTSAVPR
jgi:hypothetical protein